MKILKTLFKSLKAKLGFSTQDSVEKPMAKITLDDHGGGTFEFNIGNLIFIGFDEKSKQIVVCVAGQEPKFLPLTVGNVQFLKAMALHLADQLDRGVKKAQEMVFEVDGATPPTI